MISANSVASNFWYIENEAFVLRQQFLYFLPLPQGQGALRPVFIVADSSCAGYALASPG